MALHYFTREEFELELVQAMGLTKSDVRTASSQGWAMRGGKILLVPNAPENDRYPDYYLSRVEQLVVGAGEKPIKTFQAVLTASQQKAKGAPGK